MSTLLPSLLLLGAALHAPKIVYFQADPESIEAGQTATLRWSVKRADTVRLSPGIGGVESTGAFTVSPTTTTTYVLSAAGTGGEASASLTVTVRTPPPSPPPPPRVTSRPTPVEARLPEPAGLPFRAPGRDLLLGAEDARFGLFSYLLIPRQPDAGTPRYQRCEALVRAFLKIPEAASLIKGGIKPGEINITYLPLRNTIALSGDPAQQTAKYLDAYDYRRAAALLARMQRRVYDGPYLVSTATPLSAGAPPDANQVIFQDLSAVPPKVAELWMESFLNQAAQPRFWERSTRDVFLKGLVTFIAAGGEQVSESSSYFASFVWFGRR